MAVVFYVLTVAGPYTLRGVLVIECETVGEPQLGSPTWLLVGVQPVLSYPLLPPPSLTPHLLPTNSMFVRRGGPK